MTYLLCKSPPLLSSLPKINKPERMTICGGAQLSQVGSLALDRFLLSAVSAFE